MLLAFFPCPRALWRKLRTTNVIERCFVEVRRRARPMVCFAASFANLHKSRDITACEMVIDIIVYSI